MSCRLRCICRTALCCRVPSSARDSWPNLSATFGPVQTVDFTFPAPMGVSGARCSITQLTTPLSDGGRPGLLLLSDRGIDGERAALPALLATATVWKALVRDGLWDVPLIVESAQVFDTHHVALLVAAGASAVVPYLADQFAESLEEGGAERMRAAINAGLRKVLARMGVSTLASYRNSHLFEIVGLSEDFCSEFFEDVADFPGQKSLDDLLKDYLRMHTTDSPARGRYGRFRALSLPQGRGVACEFAGNCAAAARARESADERGSTRRLRNWLNCRGRCFCAICCETVASTPIPIEEVESAEEIVKNFSTQAMSLGSLGLEAHRTLALAMNQLGGRSNTGEGGEDPELYT